MKDLRDIRDKARAVVDLGCHDDFQRATRTAFEQVAGPQIVIELIEEIARLRDEIGACSHHHAQSWQLPDWAKTKADINAATEEQLNDIMGSCHVEDGDPHDKCLACYAYGVACKREDEQKESLATKQRARGFSDGHANHSPSLLKGPYMEGYIEGRSEPRSPDA